MTDTFTTTRMAWVFDETARQRMMAALEDATVVSWDLETTGLNEFNPTSKIVLASFSIPVDPARSDSEIDTWVLPLYHPESPWLGSWRKVYREAALVLARKFLIAHNGKYDCRWTFRHTGVNLAPALMWDSRVSSHSLDENSSTKLKVRAPRTFDIEAWDDDIDLSKENAALEIPLFDLGYYAARDTYWTLRLATVHRHRMFTMEADEEPYSDDEIEDARLGQLSTLCTMPTTRTLAAMEQRGFLLDAEWVAAKIAEDEALRDEHKEWLVAKYPPLDHEHASDEDCPDECVGRRLRSEPSFAPTAHWFRDWTERAVAAKDLRVASMTKGGKPQWSKNVLIRQERTGSEVAKRLLIYRGAVKRLEYLNAWLGYQRDDGAIHANYNVGSLITGRLSSSEPNMQQVTKKLRAAFVARPGYVLADLDYSQIELRVAAFISRCRPMIEAFQRGDDLHMILALQIMQRRENNAAKREKRAAKTLTIDDITPEQRQAGKSANFGLLYLMGAFGFREYAENVYDVSFTMEEAEEIHATFFETWDGMRAWHQRAIKTAHATGQVVSPIGRVRRVPLVHSDDDGKRTYAERAAVNAPVQGFASDLMQMAAASIEGYLPGHSAVRGARLVATVHDSIVVEVEESRWSEIVDECVARMVGVTETLKLLGCEFDVPLVADATVGTRWGLDDISNPTEEAA